MARYTSTATNAIVASATTAAKMVPASIRFRCSRNTVGPTDLRSSNGSGAARSRAGRCATDAGPAPCACPAGACGATPRPRSPGCRSAKTSRWARFCPAIDGSQSPTSRVRPATTQFRSRENPARGGRATERDSRREGWFRGDSVCNTAVSGGHDTGEDRPWLTTKAPKVNQTFWGPRRCPGAGIDRRTRLHRPHRTAVAGRADRHRPGPRCRGIGQAWRHALGWRLRVRRRAGRDAAGARPAGGALSSKLRPQLVAVGWLAVQHRLHGVRRRPLPRRLPALADGVALRRGGRQLEPAGAGTGVDGAPGDLVGAAVGGARPPRSSARGRPGALVPTEQAMLWALRARAHAEAGEVEATEAAIGTADQWFARDLDECGDRPWVAHYSHAHHWGTRAWPGTAWR